MALLPQNASTHSVSNAGAPHSPALFAHLGAKYALAHAISRAIYVGETCT